MEDNLDAIETSSEVVDRSLLFQHGVQFRENVNKFSDSLKGGEVLNQLGD
jgi:hypothetical protein